MTLKQTWWILIYCLQAEIKAFIDNDECAPYYVDSTAGKIRSIFVTSYPVILSFLVGTEQIKNHN